MTQPLSTVAIPLCLTRGHDHSLDALSGYDVVVTLLREPDRASAGSTWPEPTSITELEVVAVVQGANQYARALELARTERQREDRTYAYVAHRYECGCREVGYLAAQRGAVLVADAGA